jgi:hypothetical protein
MYGTSKPAPAFEDDAPLRPWIALESREEIEAWIARLDRELQQHERERIRHTEDGVVQREHARSHGVRLFLQHGGNLRLHTNPDGDILLEVSRDADWVAPLIAAATGISGPRGSAWLLPAERLVELITGLNSLVEAEQLVVPRRLLPPK